jgi:mono/diheme cytochrome c family protein
VRRWAIALGAAIAVAAAVGGWLSLSQPPDAEPAAVAQIDLGRTVYTAHCASCHGARLEGQPNWRERRPDGRLPAPPHDATGHTWHHSDRQLIEITKRGAAGVLPGYRSDMPAYGETLSDGEIRAVIAYIKSRWPASVRKRQPRDEAAG